MKKSEVHGMAQRGGSVITHVKFGKKVYSPLIEEGTADFLLSFEKLEALRYLHYLRKNGQAIVNKREISPMSVLTGAASYPKSIEGKIRKWNKTHFVDADKIALELGNIRTVNIILLGMLATFLTFKQKSWVEAIKKNVKEKFITLNITAFNRGKELITP